LIWNPVLDGELAQSARAILTDLTAELARAPAADGDASLANGSAGAGLLFDHLARADGSSSFDALATSQLMAAKAALPTADPKLGLYAGVTGVAWALEHTGRTSGASDFLGRVNAALQAAIAHDPWRGPFSLDDGLVGMGVYLFERRDQPQIRACLERLVDRLDENATREVAGISWHTSPRWLSPRERACSPRGHFDLGLAHGVPGVIALLAKLHHADIARARCDALLAGAVRWLLAQARIGEASFPSHVGPELAAEPTRSAWCYGDPGVAAALLMAARHVDNREWEAEAERIALTACRRPLEHTGVIDASICHGASGLGLIYQRLFHATGNPAFRDAARDWYARAMAMRTPGDGVAGYLAWSPNAAGVREWRAERALLSGAIGVALALHAGLSNAEPRWDRMLLLDLDPAAS
jgi:lantibiotic modifying enzyme